MAGTTLRGIGEDESDEATPPPEKEAASGPTVVDNAKVAESLRKLRSMEDKSAAHNLAAATKKDDAKDAKASAKDDAKTGAKDDAKTSAADDAKASASTETPQNSATHNTLLGGTDAPVESVDNEETVPMAASDLPAVVQSLAKPPAASGRAQTPAGGTLQGGMAVGTPSTKTPAPISASGQLLSSAQTGITGTLMGQPSQTLLGLPLSASTEQPAHPTKTLFGQPAGTLLGQSVGTLLGHPPVPEGPTRPVPVADAASDPARPFRTLFGHSAPLPDGVAREAARSANARRLTPIGADGGGVPSLEFAAGDQHFFESEPINDLYEPEFPRPKMFTKVAFGVAAASVIVVAVLAYVRFSGDDAQNEETAAVETAPATPAATPAPAPAPSAAAPPAPANVPAPSPENLPAAPTTAAAPPSSADPATTPTPPTPVATPPSPPAAAVAETELRKEEKKAETVVPSPMGEKTDKAQARKEPGERPKLEATPQSKPPESRPAIAKTETKKEPAKPAAREPVKSPVAKLATKEPARETPAKPAAVPKPVVTTAKSSTPKPVAATPKPVSKFGGFQARTDGPKPTTGSASAPKPIARPVTSLSAKDSASRPMKITTPTAPGVRPATAPKPGGRPRVEDDPDATLPLSE